MPALGARLLSDIGDRWCPWTRRTLDTRYTGLRSRLRGNVARSDAFVFFVSNRTGAEYHCAAAGTAERGL